MNSKGHSGRAGERVVNGIKLRLGVMCLLNCGIAIHNVPIISFTGFVLPCFSIAVTKHRSKPTQVRQGVFHLTTVRTLSVSE